MTLGPERPCCTKMFRRCLVASVGAAPERSTASQMDLQNDEGAGQAVRLQHPRHPAPPEEALRPRLAQARAAATRRRTGTRPTGTPSETSTRTPRPNLVRFESGKLTPPRTPACPVLPLVPGKDEHGAGAPRRWEQSSEQPEQPHSIRGADETSDFLRDRYAGMTFCPPDTDSPFGLKRDHHR